MGRLPFEIVNGLKPRTPLDLSPCHYNLESVREVLIFVDICRKSTKKHVEFQPGDLVLTLISRERFPQGAMIKLHSHKAGPFKVLRHLGPNAYLFELPPDVQINPIFNDHRSATLSCSNKPREAIEAILDDQIVST
ncbi:hypothetical protein I3760_05G187300 [Carya illinoinensis]|nr:hypothetical protein I3760_05G187300 [Carya illinoinensis]